MNPSMNERTADNAPRVTTASHDEHRLAVKTPPGRCGTCKHIQECRDEQGFECCIRFDSTTGRFYRVHEDERCDDYREKRIMSRAEWASKKRRESKRRSLEQQPSPTA